MVNSHLGDRAPLVVGQANKQMIRIAAFWVGFDLGCLLVAGKIRKSPAGRKPRNLPLAVGRLVEAVYLTRNLAFLDGSLHRDSRAAAAF